MFWPLPGENFEMSLCLCLIRIVAEFFGTEFFGTIFRYEISIFWPLPGENFWNEFVPMPNQNCDGICASPFYNC